LRYSWFSGIRLKLILLGFTSSLLSSTSVYIARLVFHSLVAETTFGHILSFIIDRIYHAIGVQVSFFVFVQFFFAFYVLLLSRRSVNYLLNITDSVEKISNADFNVLIPINRSDELGLLANQINAMSEKLKVDLEQKLRAIQSKNELVTNVSHDLRTPLTSVIGYLRLVDSDRYKDEVELRHYTRIAYEKSLALGRMVNDLFEYTKMASGQVVLHRSDIDLVELIGQVSADFALQLAEAEMEVKLRSNEEQVILYADGDKLMRLFANLISNAIKYGEKGSAVEVIVRTNRDKAIIQLKNKGIPIPWVDLPHIFDRFYRVEKSRSQETGGSGLGLAIVKSMVDLHHGSITAASNEEETMFEVRLPLADRDNL
jgi:signal transduction histidine kinase